MWEHSEQSEADDMHKKPKRCCIRFSYNSTRRRMKLLFRTEGGEGEAETVSWIERKRIRISLAQMLSFAELLFTIESRKMQDASCIHYPRWIERCTHYPLSLGFSHLWDVAYYISTFVLPVVSLSMLCHTHHGREKLSSLFLKIKECTRAPCALSYLRKKRIRAAANGTSMFISRRRERKRERVLFGAH